MNAQRVVQCGVYVGPKSVLQLGWIIHFYLSKLCYDV